MKIYRYSKLIAKRVVYEMLFHRHRLKTPATRPCVLIFPSDQPWSASSNLRAWLPAIELRKLGWRVLLVPEPLSLGQRRRIIALEKPDVILLQQTRHVLNQPKLYRPYPCVLDADDADFLDPRFQEVIRESARDATTIIGGSRFVALSLAENGPDAHVLWTCTPRPDSLPAQKPEERRPIVAWAHAAPLLFIHEAAFIQEVIKLVCQKMECEFWLFGTTEDEAKNWFSPIRELGGKCIAVPSMQYEKYLETVALTAIGLQPIVLNNDFSKGRSFGKILAYLSGQVAVVASRSVDHPLFFKDGINGLLPEHDPAAWSEAICRLLLDNSLRCQIAYEGWKDFSKRLTTDTFSELLDPILRKAAGLHLSVEQITLLDKTAIKNNRIVVEHKC